MNKIIINLVLLFLMNSNIAQKWANTYGTSSKDENFQDVILSYDNGYIISGNYELNTWYNWIIKTDINGETIWSKSLYHNEYEVFSGAIDQNSSGELIIARCISFEGGEQWPSIIKLDECGNKLWCRVFYDTDFWYGWFADCILYENGDVLALGFLQANGNYHDQIFLYYINSNGSLLWKKSYSPLELFGYDMPRNPYKLFFNEAIGQYIIVGRCYYPNPGNPNTGYKRPFFIGIDDEFKEQWLLPFGHKDNMLGKAIDVITLNDSIYMGTGYSIKSNNAYITLLAFFNDKGEEIGYTEIPNDAISPDNYWNITNSILPINDSLYITSTYFGPEDNGTNPFGELVIDTAGNIYNLESRPNTEGISKMIKTNDNKFVVGCSYQLPGEDEDIYLYKINENLELDSIYSGIYTYDSLCPYQIESGNIDVSDCLITTDVGETPTPEEYFASLKTIKMKAFPNPANTGEVTIQLSNTKQHNNMELKCFDVFGKLVDDEKIYQHQGEAKIDISNWKSGIYFTIIYSEGKPVGECKFVVR